MDLSFKTSTKDLPILSNKLEIENHILVYSYTIHSLIYTKVLFEKEDS